MSYYATNMDGSIRRVGGCIAEWQYKAKVARERGLVSHAAWLLMLERFARFQQRIVRP